MLEPDDHALLAEFALSESGAAFATLVARYVNLVHSTALRFTANAHHAEEITQAVFIILARKAGSLSRKIVLSGWLYQTARLTAANFVKGEIRRQKREQEAYMLQSTLDETDARAWEKIAPLLDEVMGRLGGADRDAIVLRFFENNTARETGAALEITEAAAHKRVSRALEKLRKLLAKRGVALPAALVASAMAAGSVQAAPAGLAVAVGSTVAAKAVVPVAIITLVKTTLNKMTLLKVKIAIGIGAAVLLAGGAAEYCKQGEAKMSPGEASGRGEDDDGALADFNRAIELDPKYAHAYVMRGLAKAQKQDLAGAVKDYEKAMMLDPKDGDAYEGRGMLRWRGDDLQGALADFNHGIELKRDGFSIFFNRGFLKEKMGDFKGAIADLTHTLEIMPRTPENASPALTVQDKLTVLYLLNHETKKAVTQGLKTVELGAKYDFGKENLAHAYLADGQYEKAKALYLDIQRESPKLFKQATEQLRALEKRGVAVPDAGKIEALQAGGKTE